MRGPKAIVTALVLLAGVGAAGVGVLGLDAATDHALSRHTATAARPVSAPVSPVAHVVPAQQVAPRVSVRSMPALFARGDDGAGVRRLQARLRQIGWFFRNVTDHYGDRTVEAVRGFQTKRGVPSTGKVDRSTLRLLVAMTREPTRDELANIAPDPADGAALDPRCTTGRVLCIDKTSRSLRWVVDGTVRMSLDARFGAWSTPTREGLFHVYLKDRDHVSHQFGSAMPFSMFFSGGQAVHYSSDFAARGYYGASHGCVNIRDYNDLATLFDEVRVGDTVVVYNS